MFEQEFKTWSSPPCRSLQSSVTSPWGWSCWITPSQCSECFKFWSSELLPRVMEFRLTHFWLKWHFCTLQYLALMSNKSLEFCIKNFLSSVATQRVVLYYSRLDFLPRGTWLVPPAQPRLFMPHYVLPQFPFSVPLQRSLSVHMILAQTWELSLMILLLFLFSIPAILYIF
jgi:hypothetical protein